MTKSREESIFAAWLRAMGFHKKQVTEAGAFLDLSPTQAHRRSDGRTPVTHLDQLGMTAAWLGLPAFESHFADLSEEDLRRLARHAQRIRAILESAP
jgi:hypothetical protein